MGKPGAQVQVSEHYMSLHVGVCAAGQGLELVAIKVGDKEAWRGVVSNNTVGKIDLPDLFGGNKKEGGVKGLFWWLNGNEKQRLPGPLWSRFGLTGTTCPGFRGLASIVFSGLRNDNTEDTSFLWSAFAAINGTATDEKGFHWSSNNPYLKAISVRVRRAPQGLNPSIALIRVADDSKGNQQWSANPAHIIFETMTNRDWGMGESFGAFNIGSFEQAAQVLYDEDFGVNMIWTRQSKIEDFVKEVLDHIQGALFVDPATGKHTLKLLRAVAPEIVVPQVNPDNAKLSNFKMKLWGDISNEIIVTWTNPETGKEETVGAQDLAAIGMQGAQPASDSRNYYGIASQALAISVAERDLAAVVHPIATCDVEVTKAFWKTVIYDTVELIWPDRAIESAFFRVAKVTAGTTANTVKLSLYEDIFSLDRTSYLTPTDTGWVNPSLPPEPLIYLQTGTAPAFMTAAVLEMDDISELIYPEVISGFTIGPDNEDDIGYELIGYESLTTGEIVQVSLGDRQLRGTWLTDIVMDAEVTTVVPDIMGYLGLPPSVGQFVLIGQEVDEDTEIALIRAIDGSGYTLDRGMLDTTPKEWPIGTRLWFIPTDTQVPDPTRRAAFETASYHFRTRTSVGILPLIEAVQTDIVLSERPHLPNRPANVQIAGTAFGTYDLAGGTSMLVTWARRNRINESAQALLWTDSDMAPETGQTTTIYITEPDLTPITAITGLTGTSYLLSRAEFAGNLSAVVRVVAVRDGLESLQGHEIGVTMNLTSDDILALSGDMAGNTLALSGDMAPGNLIV